MAGHSCNLLWVTNGGLLRGSNWHQVEDTLTRDVSRFVQAAGHILSSSEALLANPSDHTIWQSTSHKTKVAFQPCIP